MQVQTTVTDEDGNTLNLSSLSSYTVETYAHPSDTTPIRIYTVGGSLENGKLTNPGDDDETIQFYIETRDSDDYKDIFAYLKARQTDTEVYDGKRDSMTLIEQYNFY